MKKISTSFTLSPVAKDLLDKLSKQLGIPRSAVLEVVLREKAKGEGIVANP